MPYSLIIAEKPSVARDIARVMGCRTRLDACYEGDSLRVTWALGHLVALSDPEEVDEKWKKWRTDTLPILPDVIPLKVLPKTKTQYNAVRKLMLSPECTDLICATDAGREGELIFRYLLRMAGCGKPVRRLWISSMTDEAIREGFDNLRPGSEYELLYQSARCRSEADWLVGMNASRAFTLRYRVLLSVGRVQTPTLALLVGRRREIDAFVPEDYWTVTANFGPYEGVWFDRETGGKKIPSEARARAIEAAVRGKDAVVEKVERTPKKELPPQLYDLTSLQRDANRLLGFTAKKTLDLAQKLYEEYKLLTYPRTDSRYLPRDMAGRTRSALSSLPDGYQPLVRPLTEKPLSMSRRIFDDAKVTDHHALLTTGKRFDPDRLPADARSLLDLVCRRMIEVFYPDYLYDALRVVTAAGGEAFVTNGREEKQPGWREVGRTLGEKAKKRGASDDEEQPLPDLSEGDRFSVRKTSVKAEKTKPPAPYTDASLLAAMEHAGRELEDEELRESMKNSGLGTPATRAAIIERLLQVGYAQRKGRAIQATDKGMELIRVVPSDIASPETTGRWEKALADIAGGSMQPERFLSGIRRLSVALVDSARTAPDDAAFPAEERGRRGKTRRSASSSLDAPCPLCGTGKVMENSRSFYCSRWKEGCRLTLWKNACVRDGGPVLTAALMKKLLAAKRLEGRTGTLELQEGGKIVFRPKA